MKPCKVLLPLLAVCGIAFLGSAAPALAEANITIVNVDGPGEGFNDPTPAAPVGGNPGTTLGQQRLNVFQYAADVWGSLLDSNVEIVVVASFDPLGPNVLGQAGAVSVARDFPGAVFPDTWYQVALANKLVGVDLGPGAPDIAAQFSSDFPFYLGLDNNHGALNDLATVVLHELCHGLGFANFVTDATGQNFRGHTDAYSHFTLDETTGLHWSDMTQNQRKNSAVNVRHVSWDGSIVTAQVPRVLQIGEPRVSISTPPSIAGSYFVGPASFGPVFSSPGVTGSVRLVNDGVGVTTDACEALPAGSLTGAVGLADRGTCTFVVKVKNMQNAGAVAALIADNVAGSPPVGLGGSDPTITITSGRITLADGNTIKSQLSGNVVANLGLDLSRRAGASSSGFASLWAADPVQPGSSISHWDVIATPNLLMEPSINADLTHSVRPPQDLSLMQLGDVGWFADADRDGVPDTDDQCPGSNLTPTVVIDGCDSGVPNTILPSGCTISDLIAGCAESAASHDDFVSCVSHLTNDLKSQGVITGNQKSAIMNCANSASIP
ncbi:MAG: PA domain-containing protein [Acidobacteriota bacterium]